MRKSTLGALEGDQSVKSALAEACDEFANGDRRIPAASHRVALLSKSRCLALTWVSEPDATR
jgi:hypothetical protein